MPSNSYSIAAPAKWNSLSDDIKDTLDMTVLKSKIYDINYLNKILSLIVIA